LHREQCFACTDTITGSFILHQARDCTEESESNPRSLKAQPLSNSVAPTASLCRAKADWRRKMSTISQSSAQPSIPQWSGGLVRWIAAGAHAVVAHWERRAVIRALLERDDRELRDIGIVRSQIEAAVGGAFNPHRGNMR
jgi:uncharacterized protein YjiS (DUF1127 family)